MSIMKMKRLRLAAMAEDREKLLQELLILGCVELSETEGLLDDPEWADLVHRDETALPQYRTQFMKINSALETLQKYDKQKKPLFARLPQIDVEQLFSEETLEAARQAAAEIERLEDRISRLYGEQNHLAASRAALAPWADLDLPLNQEDSRCCAFLLLTAPAAADFGEMCRDLQNATELAELREIHADREQHYMSLVVHKIALEDALTALRPHGVARTQFREYRGTAEENLKRIDAQAEKHTAEIAAAAEKIAALADRRPVLEQAADRLAQDVAREEARGKLLLTEKAVTLEGWVPEEGLPGLEALLKDRCVAWELTDPSPEEYETVPVKLKNNRLTRCLNMVTEMYSLPAYGTVDPNPLMAPFFILFYGIMMADMGYGLLMILAGIVVLRKARPRKGMRNFFELMLYCGVSTLAFGAMTGGFFGDLIPQIVALVKPGTEFAWPWPILFTPLDDTIMILLGSMVLGLVHIITGMAVGLIRKAKDGRFLDGLLDEVAWWVIFAGIALVALGKGNVGGVPVVLVLGLLMLVVGSARGKKGFGKITAVFAAIYNGVTGYFGDILSYSRLMALMLAGSVIAQVFNTIGAIPGNIFILVLVSLVGNALNFGLNLLGCFVHDLRLQCLEYFGKFYVDGGRAFEPLSIRTKYVDTIEK